MEMIVTLAILSVLISAGFVILNLTQKTFITTSQDLNNVTEKSLGERAVWLNLLNAGPSFNNINQADDNNRQFFDFLPDYPAKTISPIDAQKRVLTLDALGESIPFLIFDKDNYPPVYYDPARAYTIVTSGNVSLSGTLTFTGVNKDGYLQSLNPNIYRENQLVLLYSPVHLRPPGTAMTTAPHFTIFTGRISGNSISADNGGGVIRNTHPISGNTINSPDQFFRWAPPIGSANQMVLVAGVQLIRYRLQPVPQSALLQVQNRQGGGGFMLERQVWMNGAWTLNTPIAMGVTQAIFRRDSISTATITSDLRFNY